MEHLIPAEWFFGLAWYWLLLITAGSVVALSLGADWLVGGAAGLAYRFGLPKVIVGATIVSLGTTSPEAAVSVMAAWNGDAGLALGNAVGSIIADTGLIFGLGCLMTQLPADAFVLKRQGLVKMATVGLLALICYACFAVMGNQAELGRWFGVLMLVLLVGYMAVSVRWAKEHPQGEPFIAPQADQTPESPKDKDDSCEPQTVPVVLILKLLVGLSVVIVASHVMVTSVSVLAGQWGVPQVVIAGTLVAVGTSMPELVVGMAAIMKGHKEILLGNVIGADILNVLFVTGAAAVAKPLPLIDATSSTPAIFLWLHLPVMLVVLGLFWGFITVSIRRGHFVRWYGVPMLLLYAGYVAAGFVFGTAG
ncbi:MAG: sodium:calcium antiporter [Phycisphaera sp.]|nr:sodium:calcium antiporter [Phycisphaera sp.]